MLKKNRTIQFLEFSKEHWIALSTISIGLSMGISLFYSTQYFGKFGINYLHFADFSDLVKLLFLSNTFFISLILFIGIFLLAVISNHKVSENVDYKEPCKLKKFLLASLAVVVTPMAMLAFFAPITSPYLDASSIKRGETEHFFVTYNNGKKVIKCANIVGASTNSYIFWDFGNKNTIVIPKTQIIDFKLVFTEQENHSQHQSVEEIIDINEKRKNKLKSNCHGV